MTPAATPTSGAAEAPTGSYATAAIPEPYRILGLRLRPFSLGHYLLLQRFCPAALSAARLELADLLLAVLICSQRHAEFLAAIEQKNFTREITRWGKRIGLFDVAEKSALFQRYLAASLREPEYLPLQPGDESGDWAQSLKMTLLTRLNHSAEEALDLPLSQALADYFKLAESEGLLRLLTPEDLAAAAANAAALAARPQPEKESPCPA